MNYKLNNCTNYRRTTSPIIWSELVSAVASKLWTNLRSKHISKNGNHCKIHRKFYINFRICNQKQTQMCMNCLFHDFSEMRWERKKSSEQAITWIGLGSNVRLIGLNVFRWQAWDLFSTMFSMLQQFDSWLVGLFEAKKRFRQHLLHAHFGATRTFSGRTRDFEIQLMAIASSGKEHTLASTKNH